MLLPFVLQVLHGDTLVVGWIMNALGIGALIGSLFMPKVSGWLKPGSWMAAATLCLAFCTVLICCFPFLPLVVGLMTIQGLFNPVHGIISSTLIQQRVRGEQ
ncbi:transmembrane secretion effector [Thermosporothrix hazakensis]|uniref:Transmembrane secretion effector n=1 Tax=Thermosporothrix hazakensis TaxID=644383 RepID=A0A326UDJ0_THEHA|nr:MFS transporter [Thermosporothrix hazakensis]PZW36578.1 transmembrane secretion effector [Thermosporothrix hazakensis]